MEINGRTYTWEDAWRRVTELEVAISRMPIDAPLRPHFEFLTGLLEVLSDDISEQDNLVEAAEKALTENLHSLGEECSGDLLTDIARLGELAHEAKRGDHSEVLAVQI
jgi:hypothetical protein